MALLAAVSRPAAAQERDLATAAAVAIAETPAANPQAATPAQPAKPPDGFKVGDFTFKPGGRIKLDVIRDFNPIGNEDSFVVQTIPIDGGKRTNSNLIAKETRLNIDIRGPAEGHELRMFIEGDFYGSGTTFRLRHAYGVWRGLLAGQTWSTFVDEDNLPRTIDFEAPTAFAQIRLAQLRYTRVFGSLTWAVSVEDNKSAIIVPANIPGQAEFPAPNFATRFRYVRPNGHIQASAFVGASRFRPSAPPQDPDTVALWGTALSINFTTWGRDTAYGVLTYGPGVGGYRSGITAVPDEIGRLHAVPVTAYMAGYEHFWAEKWSSNAVASSGFVPEEPFYTADLNRQLDYLSANLLYWFLGARAWMGVEFLYGNREVFGPGPNSGIAHRLQYGVRFNLP